MNTFYDLIKRQNNLGEKLEFLCNGVLVGFIHPAMKPFIRSPLRLENNKVHFDSDKYIVERTALLEQLFLDWKAQDIFHCLRGWRNERYSVYGPSGVLFDVERAACGLVGVRTYGCHLNGYVQTTQGLRMWIGKRSLQKQTYPGMLDQVVAGGLASGSTPSATIIKECEEEAGIPILLAQKAKPVGFIAFWKQSEYEIQPATNYVYDLELPSDFVPVPQDGEVDSFQLLDMEKVKELVLAEQFKPEAMIVVVDFLVRHGLLNPDTEPRYLELCMLLKTTFPFHGPSY